MLRALVVAALASTPVGAAVARVGLVAQAGAGEPAAALATRVEARAGALLPAGCGVSVAAHEASIVNGTSCSDALSALVQAGAAGAGVALPGWCGAGELVRAGAVAASRGVDAVAYDWSAPIEPELSGAAAGGLLCGVAPSAARAAVALASFYRSLGHAEVLALVERGSDQAARGATALADVGGRLGLLVRTSLFSGASALADLRTAATTRLHSFVLLGSGEGVRSVLAVARAAGLDSVDELWVVAVAGGLGATEDWAQAAVQLALPVGSFLLSPGRPELREGASEAFLVDAVALLALRACNSSSSSSSSGGGGEWQGASGALGLVALPDGGGVERDVVAMGATLFNVNASGALVAVASWANLSAAALAAPPNVASLAPMTFAGGLVRAPGVRGENFMVGVHQGYDLGDYSVPMCWITSTDPQHPSYGVSLVAPVCPPGLELNFTEPLLPQTLTGGVTYDVRYALRMGTESCPLGIGSLCSADNRFTLKNGWTVPHANVHSCSSDVALCTPTIKNDGQLSTHTTALTSATNSSLTQFQSQLVLLREGLYTVIAHARVFTLSAQWDIAVATRIVVSLEGSAIAMHAKGYHLGGNVPVCWRTSLENADVVNYLVARQTDRCPPGLRLAFGAVHGAHIVRPLDGPAVPIAAAIISSALEIEMRVQLGGDETNGTANVVGISRSPLLELHPGAVLEETSLLLCDLRIVTFCTPFLSSYVRLVSAAGPPTAPSGEYSVRLQLGQLPAGEYTMLASTRVRLREAVYDIATAIQLEVNELEVQQRIPETAKTVLCVLAATSQLLALLVVAWAVRHRRQHIIREMRLEVILLICLGSFVSSVSVYASSVEDADGELVASLCCLVDQWCDKIGALIIAGALLSKVTEYIGKSHSLHNAPRLNPFVASIMNVSHVSQSGASASKLEDDEDEPVIASAHARASAGAGAGAGSGAGTWAGLTAGAAAGSGAGAERGARAGSGGTAGDVAALLTSAQTRASGVDEQSQVRYEKREGPCAHLLRILALLCAVDLPLLVLMTALSPPQYVRVPLIESELGVALVTTGRCTSGGTYTSLIVAYHVLCLGYCSLMFVRLQSAMGNSTPDDVRLYAGAIFTTFQVATVSSFVMIAVKDSPNSTFVFKSLLMLARSFGVVALTFLPAARIIHRHLLPRSYNTRQATHMSFNHRNRRTSYSVAPAP
jgi:hypothetical protein